MPKTLLTGGTGFIGSAVARALAERGDDVRVTVREGSDTEAIDGLGFEHVRADVLDRGAVRRALRGVDRVFHCAGVTSVRPVDAQRTLEVNIGGTRTVLEECLRAGVQRVVHCSSAAAIGPAARNRTADERQLYRAAPLKIPYVESTHRAEAEAMRLAGKGLPVTCVNPTAVFGPGDMNVTSTRLVRSFLIGRVPAYADGALNVVDVRDVASGHLLADEAGQVGERYILGGRNFTFDRLFADLGRISGIEPPVKVPLGLASVAATLLPVGAGRTTLTPHEVIVGSQFWTYSSAKAKRELAWHPRPHEETLEATVDWYLDREHDRIRRERRSQQLQYRVAGALIGGAEDGLAVGRRLLGGLARLGR